TGSSNNNDAFYNIPDIIIYTGCTTEPTGWGTDWYKYYYSYSSYVQTVRKGYTRTQFFYDFYGDYFTIKTISPFTVEKKPQIQLNGNPIYTIVYSSSDTNIVTVNSNGVLTGKKAGKATITAAFKDGFYSDSIIVRVLFTDVADSSKYFYSSVYWALDNGITTGTKDYEFSPNKACTRGQVVTFLWRLMGSPRPQSANPFKDVERGEYYYDAVRWANENGITTGTSSTTFSPHANCSREQIVTFLYRTAVLANGGNAPSYTPKTMKFQDVNSSAYYYEAIRWAYSTNITTGESETQFGIGKTCVRGMVVTFLKRYNDAY
ncbi:MAG: S-layer homology domain-containing protein, partial [Erysipelotrichaceae bacterium]|nr:S-layer homology domain-containing protein [Erysipelotrichaceae bacterium]